MEAGMFEKAKAVKKARAEMENNRKNARKEIVSACGFVPWQVVGFDKSKDCFLVQIRRGEKSCPIVTSGDNYDPVRAWAKGEIERRGYKGYNVGVQRL
jgi:hypothetical protein